MVRFEYGRRRALLIGINYSYRGHPDTPDELKGCIDDVDTLGQLLLSSGWSLDDMMILTDNTRHQLPTRKNIINAARWLVHDARPGDVFFFSYSGHGAQETDPHGYEEDGLNETILPLDANTRGMITDDELNAILVRNLPSGCKLMAVIDACHSGTQLDLPYTLNTTFTSASWKEETNPLHTKGDVQLISGCRDNETSSDGNRGGAMTKALVTVLRQNPHGLTFPELLNGIHRVLRSRGFWQRPELTSSQRFPLDRPFIVDDIMPNQNHFIGRVVRKRFAPKKEQSSDEVYSILRLYALKIPDILHFWGSGLKRAFRPTRKAREYSMGHPAKPNRHHLRHGRKPTRRHSRHAGKRPYPARRR